jgi:hypothetical protein
MARLQEDARKLDVARKTPAARSAFKRGNPKLFVDFASPAHVFAPHAIFLRNTTGIYRRRYDA